MEFNEKGGKLYNMNKVLMKSTNFLNIEFLIMRCYILMD